MFFFFPMTVNRLSQHSLNCFALIKVILCICFYFNFLISNHHSILGVPTTIEYHKLILDIEVGNPLSAYKPSVLSYSFFSPQKVMDALLCRTGGLQKWQSRYSFYPEARGRVEGGEAKESYITIHPFLTTQPHLFPYLDLGHLVDTASEDGAVNSYGAKQCNCLNRFS